MAKGKTDWTPVVTAVIGLGTIAAITGGFKYLTGDTDPPPVMGFDSSKIPEGWTPNVLASRIATSLQGLNPLTIDSGISLLVTALNRDQSIWLSNYYNKLFFKNDNKTIVQLLLSEMEDFDVLHWRKTNYRLAANHLQTFGIQ